ncbi:MAG TPA: MFS transporter [Streptosporangiaceae bacterium]|nr:MFS transporter [Streptosporangiaceae bacterium]
MTSRTSTIQIPVGAVAARTAGFVICMAATTLPTPLYDLYAKRFGFHTLTITVLFAVYAAGVVVTLVLFGQLSDATGRRPVMLSALAISVVSSLILASAGGLGMLLLGRVVSGLAAGLMTGTGTAAVIDLFPPGRRAAGGTLAVAANTGGLAFGTLFAGVLADLASHPLVTPYLAQAVLGVLACAALLVTPAYGPAAGRRFRFSTLRVPAAIRGNYVRAVLSGGAAFAVTGVLTSVSALFLLTVLHDTSHVLAGSVVAIVFMFMAGGQLAARRTTPHRAMLAGCAGLALAGVVLLLALTLHSLAALLIAAVALGASGGVCLNAGVATTVGQVRQDQRGGVSSAYFAGLYVFLACPAVGVGVIAAHTSLITAGVILCVVVIGLATAIAGLEFSAGRSTPAATKSAGHGGE